MKRYLWTGLLVVSIWCIALSARAVVSGLGQSTLTCLDKDGDGFGVGPGCSGPDADDLAAAVHTGGQALSAHGGTITGWLQYRGYPTGHVWYIAPTGNDSTCVENDATRPCATFSRVNSSAIAGRVVIFREGTYRQSLAPTNSGSAGNPIVFMSYPGELPLSTPAVLARDFISWIGPGWLWMD